MKNMKTWLTKLVTIMTIISTIGLNGNVRADEPDNVYLLKGASVPYDGILSPVSRAQRYRLLDIDLTTCTKRLDLSAQDNTISEERISNLKVENKELREEVAKKTGFWQTFGGIIIGSGITILITYGVKQATK